MGSVPPVQASTMREHSNNHLHLQDTNHTERSQWVLNSPNPPPPWTKILHSLKHAAIFSCSKNKAFYTHVVSFFHSLFPILTWFRDYKPSKFKDDLLAGLTLASLSIPQVFTNFFTSVLTEIV